MDAMIIGLKPA